MIGSAYRSKFAYDSQTDRMVFHFTSTGTRDVDKVVSYEPTERVEFPDDGSSYYNMALADLIYNPATQEIVSSDTNETNNGDTKKVFYTLVETMTRFHSFHPDAIIHIAGSTQQRMDVYRKLIARHWQQLELIYRIRGYGDGILEDFQNGRTYEFLLISKL